MPIKLTMTEYRYNKLSKDSSILLNSLFNIGDKESVKTLFVEELSQITGLTLDKILKAYYDIKNKPISSFCFDEENKPRNFIDQWFYVFKIENEKVKFRLDNMALYILGQEPLKTIDK